MDMAGIVIVVAWVIMSLLTFIQYSHCFKEMKFKNTAIAYTIFIIGGPFFCITSILNGMLNWVMPIGWDDEDDDGYGI